VLGGAAGGTSGLSGDFIAVLGDGFLGEIVFWGAFLGATAFLTVFAGAFLGGAAFFTVFFTVAALLIVVVFLTVVVFFTTAAFLTIVAFLSSDGFFAATFFRDGVATAFFAGFARVGEAFNVLFCVISPPWPLINNYFWIITCLTAFDHNFLLIF
jgi:hypothetical protein